MSGLAKKHLTEDATITISGPKRNLKQVLRLVNELDFEPVEGSASLDWRQVFKKEIEKYTEPGAALAGTRHREGLSQVALAKKSGTTQSAISAMEKGYRPIGKQVAKRLAKVLNTDYRTLL